MKTTKLRLVRFGSAKALTRDGLGTVFEEAGIFQSHVVVDGRLVTGQNPASARPFGEAVVAALATRARP